MTCIRAPRHAETNYPLETTVSTCVTRMYDIYIRTLPTYDRRMLDVRTSTNKLPWQRALGPHIGHTTIDVG